MSNNNSTIKSKIFKGGINARQFWCFDSQWGWRLPRSDSISQVFSSSRSGLSQYLSYLLNLLLVTSEHHFPDWWSRHLENSNDQNLQKILKKGPMNTTLKETNMGFKTNPKVQSLPKTVEPHQAASSDVAKGRWDSLDPAPLSLSLPARLFGVSWRIYRYQFKVNLPLSLGKCRCCAEKVKNVVILCNFLGFQDHWWSPDLSRMSLLYCVWIVLCLSYPVLDPCWYLTSHSTAKTSQN